MVRARAVPVAAALLAAVVVGMASPAFASERPVRPRTPKPGSVSISFVGDTILGDTPSLPADPAHYLDAVKGSLDHADVVFGNLEGTLTTSTDSKCGSNPSPNCFDFKNPPSYGGVFAGDGFDVMNSANNHSHDFGELGVLQTSASLQRHDIDQTGLPGQIAIVTDGKTKVAFVGFAPYSNTCNLLDYGAAKTLIRRAVGAADVVVVYMHAGAEGAGATHVTGREEYAFGEDRGNPRKFAHFAVDNGADLVLASGPHVLRGMEFYRHRLIAYSLGNFAAFHNFGTGGVLSLSGILQVTVGPHGWFGSGHLVSTKLNDADQPHHDWSHQAVELVHTLSNDDFGPHAARFSDEGLITPPS
ncbi:MAG TPA: CapA family protein [Actinomycetota bacterium]|nr:CapA family protein [Actinomycetota bacterium]